MLRHRHIDRICIAVMVLALIIAVGFMYGEAIGIVPASREPLYASRLFDASRVHTVDIVMEDWPGFLETAAREEYSACTVVIDGERFSNVGIRAKGNSSRRLIGKYGHDRYSLKIQFDRYADSTYYGLDKFSLDSSFQDNSYMKTWISFDMMERMGVPTPLCSYVWVRVNGGDWGLFLAVEEPEQAFARRCFGPGYGQLYKPDYRSLDDENADVALRYIDDDIESYDNIFRNAKFKSVTDDDKRRLIEALKTLDTGENLDSAVDVDGALRYFTVQVFVVNEDSYLGRTGHNYFLHEKEGVLTILPWDYNLAFGTYSIDKEDKPRDAATYVNYPINTPAEGKVMLNRPLYHNLMKKDGYFERYHQYFDRFIADYFESGYFEAFIAQTRAMISPYVQKDPTAFCSYDEFLLGADTLTEFCLLRAQSVRAQLEGRIPATIAGQLEDKRGFIDASHIRLADMGEIADLED